MTRFIKLNKNSLFEKSYKINKRGMNQKKKKSKLKYLTDKRIVWNVYI